MSLVSFRKLGRTLDEDAKGIRTYTQTYLVQWSDLVIGPRTVAASLGVNYWDYWTEGETDTSAYLQKVTSTPLTSEPNGWWTVVFTYSNEPLDQGLSGGLTDGVPGGPSGGPGQANANVAPNLRQWSTEVDAVEFEKPVEADVVTGRPIAASNGQPFDPPVTVPGYRLLLTHTGYKAIGADNRQNAANFVGKVNSAPWDGFAAGQVLCKKYSLKSQYEQGDWWWQKTVVVEIKKTTFYDAELEALRTIGWNPVRVLDQGTFYLDSSNGTSTPRPIKDLSGNPSTSPMPLNGSGQPLSVNDVLAGRFKFLEFSAYESVDFTNIL